MTNTLQATSQEKVINTTVDPLSVATEAEVLETVNSNVVSVNKAQVEVIVEDDLSSEDIKKADSFMNQLLNKEISDPTILIDSVGSQEVRNLQSLSKSLDGPIKNMTNENSESAKIGKGLIDLKVKIDEVNPSKFNFEAGWFGRIIGKITGQSNLNKYFTKFESTRNVIESINQTLEEGKMSLIEDNAIFQDDKQRYRESTKSLENKIKILLYTDDKLVSLIPTLKPEEKTFVENEVLFPLRQQIQDLQQTLAVTAQGVIALDILIKNNKELINGVKRTQNVTLTALSIGATVAGGLATQKRVLETTQAVNNTTNDIIASNAELLKTQGAAIQKQAASSMLDMAKLQKALEDTVSAIEDIESFKSNALPQMKESISKLNEMNSKVEGKIKRMEAAEKVQISN